MRRAPDPARVEQPRPRAHPQKPAALGKKGPPLSQEGLELRQVDLGRIGFHLTEVRVEGGIEGQVRAQMDLQIGARLAAQILFCAEGIVPLGAAASRTAARSIGGKLDAGRRLDFFETGQPTEMRNPAGFVLGNQQPEILAILRRHQPPDIEPPHLLRAFVEAQLRKGNAHLGHPAAGAFPRRRFPDRIKGVIALDLVVGVVVVQTHAGGRDPEAVGRAPIPEGIQ